MDIDLGMPGSGFAPAGSAAVEDSTSSKNRTAVSAKSQDVAGGDSAPTVAASSSAAPAPQAAGQPRQTQKAGKEVESEDEETAQQSLLPTTMDGKGRKRQADFTSQRDLVAEAFAGDDVVADFEKDKKRQMEADAPQVEDNSLPGWVSQLPHVVLGYSIQVHWHCASGSDRGNARPTRQIPDYTSSWAMHPPPSSSPRLVSPDRRLHRADQIGLMVRQRPEKTQTQPKIPRQNSRYRSAPAQRFRAGQCHYQRKIRKTGETVLGQGFAVSVYERGAVRGEFQYPRGGGMEFKEGTSAGDYAEGYQEGEFWDYNACGVGGVQMGCQAYGSGTGDAGLRGMS